MRTATTIAVVLAVVATALAGVKEQSETRRLQIDIPRLERRRDLLERRVRAAEASVARALSPRSLLTALDIPVRPEPPEPPALLTDVEPPAATEAP